MSLEGEQEELLALHEEVQRLRVVNAQVHQGGGASSAASSISGPPEVSNIASLSLPCQATPERFVYIHQERKCPYFSGSKSKTDLSVYDWIENVEACLRDRCITNREKALFLYDHLEGEAKAEIRFRSLTDRENPEVVLQIFKELHGSSFFFVGLQKQFFERKQKDGESLKEFSHSLWALIGDIQRSYPNKLMDPDTLVRDQFVEHVRDVALRRELKSIVRQNPLISFLALRQEAINWAEEGERPAGQARVGLYHQSIDFNVEGSCNSMGTGKGLDLSALQEQFHKQQLQIDSILQSLAKI